MNLIDNISAEEFSDLTYKMSKGRCNEELLTAQEAADYLRINIKLLYKLVDSGELKSKRVGRIIRITKTAITEYLQGDSNE